MIGKGPLKILGYILLFGVVVIVGTFLALGGMAGIAYAVEKGFDKVIYYCAIGLLLSILLIVIIVGLYSNRLIFTRLSEKRKLWIAVICIGVLLGNIYVDYAFWRYSQHGHFCFVCTRKASRTDYSTTPPMWLCANCLVPKIIEPQYGLSLPSQHVLQKDAVYHEDNISVIGWYYPSQLRDGAVSGLWSDSRLLFVFAIISIPGIVALIVLRKHIKSVDY